MPRWRNAKGTPERGGHVSEDRLLTRAAPMSRDREGVVFHLHLKISTLAFVNY